MSDFTIKNMMGDVENMGEGRAPGFEARFARNHLDSEHLGVSYFHYPAGYKAPVGHRHREQEEAYVIIEGAGRMRLDDEIVDLKRWDVIRVAPGVVRGFEGGPDGLTMIAVGNDRPEGGDGEMVKDFWTE
jgi:mannose-6-phosphate isomerase-like protein (cupin superfamily)